MADYLTFGEIMLRLKTPGHERFFQSPSFEATFGGGEANVAVALHTPYFGPAYIAGMHCLAAHTGAAAPLERLYGDLEATLHPGFVEPDAEGCMTLPTGPGLGSDPDPDVIREYLVKD